MGPSQNIWENTAPAALILQSSAGESQMKDLELRSRRDGKMQFVGVYLQLFLTNSIINLLILEILG